MNADLANQVFDQCVIDYHKSDDVNAEANHDFPSDSIEALLYEKAWIDTVQWHLEDLIRDPQAPDKEIVRLKRWIDKQNQRRTDTVERIDDWFISNIKITKSDNARMNSETPAWLLDRKAILALKLFHMNEQTQRGDDEHKAKCSQKLSVLNEQRVDMARCFDELLEDVKSGSRYFRVYRQMKMYNDDKLNPVLSSRKDANP